MEKKKWSIDACLYSYHSYFSSLWFFSVYSFSLFFLFFLPFLLFPSLFTLPPFYTICHYGIYPFYPSTIFGSLWVFYQDCPLACQLPSHYLWSKWVGCATLHSQTKLLACFLPLSIFTSPIWIKIKLPHHIPLWHASSGLSPYLPLLGEMSTQ